MSKFALYSSFTLENWNWHTPDVTGIGGSETAHLEVAKRLAKRGHEVVSFVPFGGGETTAEGVRWINSDNVEAHLKNLEGYTWFVYRAPQFFDMVLPKGKYYYVAQDVGYDFTPGQLEKLTGYICLCKDHCKHTAEQYPVLKDRIFKSSNGIRLDLIEAIEKEGIVRNPKKLIYASSPDRGLELILTDWFRIREFVPDAELHVFYGRNNMHKMMERGADYLKPLDASLDKLKNQPGVVWHGRINQPDLIREMFSAGVWWYPSDWRETSCIQCMEMQACGVTPVTNRLWAVGENVYHGVMLNGIPQIDNLVRMSLVHEVIRLLKEPMPDAERQEMSQDARDTFNWEKFVTQFEGFANA